MRHTRARIKTFLTALLLGAAIFVYALPAQAAVPRCGDVKASKVRDTFDAARKIQLYFNVRSDLERACEVMEKYEEWYNGQPRDQKYKREFKDAYKSRVSIVQKEMANMRADLITLYALTSSKAERHMSETKRAVSVIDTRGRLQQKQTALSMAVRDVQTHMQR